MKRSQIKMKLLLFDESDFFSFEGVYFLFSFNRAMSRNVYLKKTHKKTDYQMVRPKKNV